MNYSEQQEILLKVIKRISSKYCHGILDIEDIKQEAYIIGAEALEKYDPEKGPLENWLSRCISNRLINMIQKNNTKNIDMTSLSEVIEINEPTYIETIYSSTEDVEKLRNVADDLPANLRKDYLRMLGGVKISSVRKNQIKEYIRDNFNG